jgi:two-component system, chemotaxis family, sensor kinase CheA
VAADPYKYFRVEARELLEQLGSGVAAAEHEASPSGVQRLLRLAHTLKGAARVVRQAEIATLAHDIEDHLEPFRETGGPVPPGEAVALLELVDAIGVRVRALAPPDPAAAPRDAEPYRTLHADVTEMDALLDGIAEAQALVGELRRTAGALRQARRRAGSVEAGLDGLPASLEAERRLEGTVQGLERELRQLRSAGEQLRLLPVGTLFASLERVIGDTARTLGKRAVFRGRGAEIRLDGPVLGALQAALVQAVRNAVAHGLESEAARAAAGKPPDGEVLVEVATRGSRVAVTCRDDGRGVDLAAVRGALQRRGAISASEAVTPEDLLGRLLGAGITTSPAVSQVSGRGVGLDVVRESMVRLAGQARLQTSQGRGTTLEMVVPVSLSSLDALLVEAAGVTAAIPVTAVRRTFRIEAASAGGGAQGETVEHEGALIPLVPLAQVLATRVGPGRRSRSGVVVAGVAGTAAFGVDRVQGRATLLVRALPDLATAHPLVSGLTLDGDGNPQPVLDPDRLVESTGGAERAATPSSTPPAPILVVDDSLTTRMLEQSILESAGYSVDLASSGEEAWTKARRQAYSLFLVDVEMPGMDGFALLERLRADPALSGIPTMLVTSRQSPEDRARGVEVGARAYIVKSEFDQGDLLERIRAVVG